MSIRDKMTELADYIRDKSDTNEQLTIDDMIDVMPEIGSIYDKKCYASILNGEFPEELVIPEGVEVINKDSFYFKDSVGYNFKNKVKRIKFPKSLKYIGSNCFSNLNNLIEIEFQKDSVIEIGDYSFNYLTNLKSLNLPSSLKKIGKYSFRSLSNIKYLKLPDSIQNIGDNSFDGASNLSHLELPANLNIINNYTFSNLSRLQYLKLGKNINTILLKGSAFTSCSNINYIENYQNLAIMYDDSQSSTPSLRLGCTYIHNNSVISKNGCGILFNTYLISYPEDIDELDIPSGVINISAYGNSSLNFTKINIPNSVKSIAPYAFTFPSLTDIEIPNSVIYIGNHAFIGASSLSSITFENNSNLKSIEPYTFANCTALTSINIPEGVTSIGDYAFQGCTLLTSITIPSTVTSIGDHAFDGCSALTSITIPSTVTSIGDYAFRYCDALTNVTIPEGITSIGNYTFYNCASFTSVTIPNTINTIGSNAFNRCIELTSIVIPEGVISIESYAFNSCSALTSITIPSTVTSIGNCAFRYCSALTEVIFVDNSKIPSIGDSAFQGCSSLISINIPENSSVYIGSGAFTDCNASLIIPTVNNIDRVYNYNDEIYSEHMDYLSKNAFNFNYQKNIISFESINYLYENAFYFSNNKICNTFIMPKNIKYIENGVFFASISSNRGVINIDHLIIRSDITTADYALYFYYNTYTCGYRNNGFKKVTYTNDVNIISKFAVSENSYLVEVNIPNSITNIIEKAFYNCTSLTTVNFENNSNLKSIEPYTFANCRALTSITIPEGVTSIGDYAFSECTSLTSVTIPEGVTSIGDYAFDGCSALTSVTIPSTVTSIGNYAFRGCNKLTNINIPSIVTNIGEGAFYNCNLLTSVVIPNGVTIIDTETFNSCSSLTSITIPEGVTNIGEGAFSDCSSLTSVTIPEGVTNIGEGAFYGCLRLTSVTIPEGVTNIGAVAFGGCSSLTSITIPEGVTSIGNNAFSDCRALTSVTIPEGVTNIGDKAFDYCNKLTNINIPSTVTSIGKYTFDNCSALTSVTIPEGVTSIGDYAFNNCNLSEINIPNSVTKIYNNAFDGNNNVTKITVPNTFTPYYNSIYLTSFTNTDLIINASSCDFTNIFNEFKPYINNSGKFKSITVIFDENVKSIGAGIFNGFVGMTNNFIIKSDYITTIEDHAFDGCTFTTFDMQIYTITSIGDYAFANCGTYSTINLYSNIDFNNIGEYIYDNTNIDAINVPYSWVNTPEGTIKDALFNNNSCKSYVIINYCNFDKNGELIRARLVNRLELNDNLSSNYKKAEYPVVLRWDGSNNTVIDYSEDGSNKPEFSTDNQIELMLDTSSDTINDSNLHTFYFTPENNGIYQIINELGDYVSSVRVIDDEDKIYIGGFTVNAVADIKYIELYAGKTYLITTSSNNEYSITIRQCDGEIANYYITGMIGGSLMGMFNTLGPIFTNPDKSPSTKIKVTINNNEYEFYNMYTAAGGYTTTYYIGSVKNTFPIVNTETGATSVGFIPDENENEIVDFCITRPWGAVFASKTNLVENDSLLLSIDLIM